MQTFTSDGTFDNVALELQVLGNRYGWGTAFLDYDNDADMDLYVVNWNVAPGNNGAKNQFYRNNGDGTFAEVTDAVGAGDSNPGYGMCVGDFNGDGFVDMFVSNNTTPSVLYQNSGNSNRWLRVRTVGTRSNRDGIGARVRVVKGTFDQIRDIDGGSSYLAHNEKVAHYGVGSAGTLDLLEVRWPSGWVDEFTDVATNQTVTVVEGSSVVLAVFTPIVVLDGGNVVIAWDVNRSVGVEGFNVYRTPADGGDEILLTGDAMLPADARGFTDVTTLPGTAYRYEVGAVEVEQLGGGETRSESVSVATPSAAFELKQNHPNPFNPGTMVSFALSAPGRARLSIYDGKGRLVRTLVDDDLGAGPHDYFWTGRNHRGFFVSSGVYFARLETDQGVRTRKMTLVK